MQVVYLGSKLKIEQWGIEMIETGMRKRMCYPADHCYGKLGLNPLNKQTNSECNCTVHLRGGKREHSSTSFSLSLGNSSMGC